jgi:hypothetical protein
VLECVCGGIQGWIVCCRGVFVFVFGYVGVVSVSVPERSKGVDSSSTVFALVGSNPTADNDRYLFTHHNTPQHAPNNILDKTTPPHN